MPNDVWAIHTEALIAFMDDGTMFKLTLLLDSDGEETDDYSLAIVGVGELPTGDWAVIDLTMFERARVH